MNIWEKEPFRGIIPCSILRDSSVVGRREMRSRRSHGFIMKLEGTTEYCADGKVWLLSAGEILFVKKGSSYYIREIHPGYSYVVNFESDSVLPEAVAKLPVPQNYDIAPLAEKMYRSWQRDTGYAALSALYGILAKSAAAAQEECYLSTGGRRLMEPVMSYLKQNLTNPELRLDMLPQLAGVSDSYLRRVFRKQYGVAPAAYVIRERIRLARRMLEDGGESSVAGIAAAVGYRDPLYFSRLFKKYMGISPTDYAREYREEQF